MKIDLEELVQAQVIDQEAATRITDYYQALRKADQKNHLIRLVSIIGVTMVGLGLLLIVAYNWDQMPKSIKLLFAILPLAGAQTSGLFTLTKKSTSITWKEVSSLAILFGVGIALALITQIYQLDYALSVYLKWWILLSLPLIYVFDSSVTSCAIWIGIAWYLSDSRWTDGSYHLGLTLGIILVAAVPYAWKLIKKQTPYAWTWHHWLVPLVLIQFLFTLNPLVCNKLTLIQLVILFMIYDSISETLFNGSLTLSHGYKVISFVGLTIMGFMMSFKFFWLGTEITRWRSCAATTHWIIPAVFAVLLIAVLVYNWSLRKDIKSHVIPGISILLVLLIASAEWLGSGGRIIANLLLLSGAGYMMYRGILTERLATLNLGVILLAIWVICRFFESDISFVWRGIIFIALGLLCFLLNFSLIRKKKS